MSYKDLKRHLYETGIDVCEWPSPPGAEKAMLMFCIIEGKPVFAIHCFDPYHAVKTVLHYEFVRRNIREHRYIRPKIKKKLLIKIERLRDYAIQQRASRSY